VREVEAKGQGGAAKDRAACEAAGGGARWRRRAIQYGEGLKSCGSATMLRSSAAVKRSAMTLRISAAADEGQAVWPGTGARRSAMLSAIERCEGG
jgi:hypothetical protein